MNDEEEIKGTVPILTYHSLDESGSVISVSPNVFGMQMRRLAERGFRGVSLSGLMKRWEGQAESGSSAVRTARPFIPSPGIPGEGREGAFRGVANQTPSPAVPREYAGEGGNRKCVSSGGDRNNASGGERVVVITFDDAFENVFEHAAPVLAEVGFGATVFAVSDYCGRKNDWPGQGEGVPILPLMEDAQLRQLASAGWEIGAHTKTHPRLAGLSDEKMVEELSGCKEQLQGRLGVGVSTVAYPYGSYDRRVREMASGLYQCAVTVEMRLARRSDDPWALPRLDAYYWRNPKVFEWFGTAMGGAYLGARSLGRRARGVLGKGTR